MILRGALIIVLINYCTLLFSQAPDLVFSRNFEARKKSIPVEIINTHPRYFYVLRLNNDAHDITIERRAKPSAEILAFTPLKLDSVNASWFNYGNLDYTVFEKNNKLYFLFEKVLNTKRTLYLKTIDTSGKSSGFLELFTQESDKYTAEYYFSSRITDNGDILVTVTRQLYSGIRRQVLILFSTEKKEIIWTKRLPLENEYTFISWDFNCTAQNDLQYLQGFYSFARSETFGVTTVLQLDSVLLWEWKAKEPAPVPRWLDVWPISRLRSGFSIADSNATFVSIQGLEEDTVTGELKELVVNIKLDASGNELYNTKNYYDQKIKDQLTFYDGSDYKESFRKTHEIVFTYKVGKQVYSLMDRTELDPFSRQDYYKELLFRHTDLASGKMLVQKIIPRKVFFFKNRTRYKTLAETMVSTNGGDLDLFLLEHPSNLKYTSENFHYKSFSKATAVWRSNIVRYRIKADGTRDKQLIFSNGDFDVVPLKYGARDQKDMIFYMNNNKFERFAILKLYPS